MQVACVAMADEDDDELDPTLFDRVILQVCDHMLARRDVFTFFFKFQGMKKNEFLRPNFHSPSPGGSTPPTFRRRRPPVERRPGFKSRTTDQRATRTD